MNIHTISKNCAAVVCALSMSANAANLVDASTMSQFVGNDINNVMGLTDGNSFKAANTVNLNNGVTKVRFQQYYQGVKVFGHSVAATQSDMGFISNVEGNFLSLDASFMARGSIVATDALDTFMGVEKDGSYNLQSERFIVVVDGEARLTNRVSFVTHTANGPTRPTAFIDANSGEVLSHYDNLQTDKVASGPGGNSKTGQYEYGTDFGFNDVEVSGSTCTMKNTNVKTVNLNNGTSATAAYSYDCPRNTFQAINGAFSPLNDAHYFGGVVFDMFDAYVGQAPLTFQLTMRVHYSNNYENAFWDGSAMTFGDGNDFLPIGQS